MHAEINNTLKLTAYIKMHGSPGVLQVVATTCSKDFFDQLIFTTTNINYKNSTLCQKIAKIFQPIVCWPTCTCTDSYIVFVIFI